MPLATCSNGHTNPEAAERCGVCGETLTTGPSPSAPVTASPAEHVDVTISRRSTGTVMIVAAIVLAIASIVMWGKETRDTEFDNEVGQFTDALGGGHFEDAAPNRTVPIGMGVVGGLLFLGGVILVASPQDGAQPSTTPTPQGSGELRPCPHCAEDIKRAANVCRFCGRDVDPVP